MNQNAIDAPEKCGRSQWLIDQIAHRGADLWIGSDRFEEFLDPMTINLDVVIDEEQIVVACAGNGEVSLLGAISFRKVEVPNLQSCFCPTRIARDQMCLCVIAAMNHDSFRDANRLFRQALE